LVQFQLLGLAKVIGARSLGEAMGVVWAKKRLGLAIVLTRALSYNRG